MKKIIHNILIINILLLSSISVYSQTWEELTKNEFRAIIVVTGMKLNEDAENYVKDLSVAEGASVRVSSRNGQLWEKKTIPFSGQGQGNGESFFTSDFQVILDSTYSISMTFKNGTVIEIDDFCLPSEWKTHFFSHSTNGTVSPTSVLRKKMDKQTQLWCYIYSVFPLSNYKILGGSQVK
ncbi:MAG: hypothetical protein QG611_691 [Bacteroidota bacterium]|nr:hypothetical protein [Bacteroidota bacterium]